MKSLRFLLASIALPLLFPQPTSRTTPKSGVRNNHNSNSSCNINLNLNNGLNEAGPPFSSNPANNIKMAGRTVSRSSAITVDIGGERVALSHERMELVKEGYRLVMNGTTSVSQAPSPEHDALTEMRKYLPYVMRVYVLQFRNKKLKEFQFDQRYHYSLKHYNKKTRDLDKESKKLMRKFRAAGNKLTPAQEKELDEQQEELDELRDGVLNADRAYKKRMSLRIEEFGERRQLEVAKHVEDVVAQLQELTDWEEGRIRRVVTPPNLFLDA